MEKTDFCSNPIEYLLEFYRTVGPVGQAELFSPGQWVPLIAGPDVNDFVYRVHDLWDYSRGREAFRQAFGDRYITLLSGVEYHEKQRQLQRDLKVELDEKKLRLDIRNSLAGAKGLLSYKARAIAIKLLWRALHPCDPVPLHLLGLFEDYFQRGAGLSFVDSYTHFHSDEYHSLKYGLMHYLRPEDEEEWVEMITPFIAGIRALSTCIQWLLLHPTHDLDWVLRYRPPFILFPLYPSERFFLWDSEIRGDQLYAWPRWFEKGELIFHAMVLPQWRDENAPLSLFGHGLHHCPGRHLVLDLLRLVQWELEECEGLRLAGGDDPLASKFTGLLVPKFDWRFE